MLLGADRGWVLAGAHLKYYTGFWSPWIIAELVRRRAEWIAYRVLREGGVDKDELQRRLRASRGRVNGLVHYASMVLRSVDHGQAPASGLSWVPDPDDVPVVQTALAAKADTLVTENRRDFPLDSMRNGVLIVNAARFREMLVAAYPNAETEIAEYLGVHGPVP